MSGFGPISVIADDLTGAAEIAGIGLRYGLATRLVLDQTDVHGERPGPTRLLVHNLDTRRLAKRDAAEKVAGFAANGVRSGTEFFKKIDSVLRGHVIAEIEALMRSSPLLDRVLLIPQNPSRGRVILPDGDYRIHGIPLAATTFANDPDFPATTSNAIDRLGRSSLPITMAITSQFPNAPVNEGAITLGHASTVEEVDRWITRRNARTLLVGGADAFESMIRNGRPAVGSNSSPPPSGRRLFVSGSTAAESRRALRVFAANQRVDILDADADRAAASLREYALAIVMSPTPGGIEADPQEIEMLLAECTRQAIERNACDVIFAEGGATATAICRAMNWTSLAVEAELAPGVVVLKPDTQLRLVIKPGSYAWPTSVFTP